MTGSANALTALVKQAAVEAVAAGNPAEIRKGEVISVNPLQIKTDEFLTLSEKQLILTEAIKDTIVEVSIQWTTEEAALHTHGVRGKKGMVVYRALEVGDIVLLLRMQGGQQFIVIDAIKRIRERTL
ncbi:DUF2577 domain-containing protein [Methanolapillus millepedarum]|uniref:DUF2577 domain-containing protein n=1 Tax=Methanolapillus millepedarum TaxID=3028296 RepID=A0AA96V5A7_9EURY|nr:hypothetical protein MsAc7_17580 [Methanosarcinaceae archaeon Ac7]